MTQNIELAMKAMRDFTTEDNPRDREISAVHLINSVLNDLEGHGAYNVLASTLTAFTGAQIMPWQSLSYIIQGVLQGWNGLQEQLQTEADSAVKH